jgi:hypothetical protein
LIARFEKKNPFVLTVWILSQTFTAEDSGLSEKSLFVVAGSLFGWLLEFDISRACVAKNMELGP